MTDYIKLGQRLVACDYWRWMPGMLCHQRLHTGAWVPVRLMEAAYNATVIDYRFVERNAVPSMNQDAARIMAEGYVTQSGWVLVDDLLPDLSDFATKGCVLQLIREAWDDPEAHFALGAAGWTLISGESRIADVVYPSPPSNVEAEAMVNVMEAAP
jgi:hypothetical protein